jgi:hypothetical protein
MLLCIVLLTCLCDVSNVIRMLCDIRLVHSHLSVLYHGLCESNITVITAWALFRSFTSMHYFLAWTFGTADKLCICLCEIVRERERESSALIIAYPSDYLTLRNLLWSTCHSLMACNRDSAGLVLLTSGDYLELCSPRVISVVTLNRIWRKEWCHLGCYDL